MIYFLFVLLYLQLIELRIKDIYLTDLPVSDALMSFSLSFI